MKKATAHRTAYGYEYKGKSIHKKTLWADMGVVFWKVDGKEFSTLKAAKEYIDSITSEQ